MLKVLQPQARDVSHQRLYARIGKFLDMHGLAPTPENYALIYQLTVDTDSPLAREVRRITADGLRLTQAEVDSLRDDYGIRGPQAAAEEVDQNALGAARLLIEQFSATIEKARAETESYGRDLEEGAAELNAAPPAPVLAKLIRLTGAILERTRSAERRLMAAETEAQALREQLVLVEEEARKDVLTDLPNRRAFEDRCAELEAAGVPRSLAICDIDHFKSINDRYGHGVGDRVLRMVARHLQSVCTGHMVARLGGEEFVVLMEELTPEEAAEILEAARLSLADRDFKLRESDEPIGRITFSAGIASSYCDHPESSILKRADALLYKAKNSGRNQIRLEGSDGVEAAA